MVDVVSSRVAIGHGRHRYPAHGMSTEVSACVQSAPARFAPPGSGGAPGQRSAPSEMSPRAALTAKSLPTAPREPVDQEGLRARQGGPQPERSGRTLVWPSRGANGARQDDLGLRGVHLRAPGPGGPPCLFEGEWDFGSLPPPARPCDPPSIFFSPPAFRSPTPCGLFWKNRCWRPPSSPAASAARGARRSSSRRT